MSEQSGIDEVLTFWFGERGLEDGVDEATASRWFKSKSDAFDEEIRSRFGAVYEKAKAGSLDDWASSPRGRLALLLLLDQFSRNMFRGSGRMFESDAKALSLALEGLALGHDRAVGVDGRKFFYMPLMHAEDLPNQERCISLFEEMRDELDGKARESAAESVGFAVRHRDIIKRFGRFPHRNEMLGRASTPEEIEFLKQPGSSF